MKADLKKDYFLNETTVKAAKDLIVDWKARSKSGKMVGLTWNTKKSGKMVGLSWNTKKVEKW